MADFRKLFLVLAVMALLALPVSAINPPVVNCVASSSPVIIRDGGLTELVGDVTLTCDNRGVDAVNVQTDIQIFMNYAGVTNKVLSTSAGGECPTGIKCVTDAVAVATWNGAFTPPVPDGVAGNPTVIIGLLQSRLDLPNDPANQRNSVLFPRVPVPAGTITYIRISNIRIWAPQVSASGSTDVFEKITTNNVVVTPNYQLPVATVQIPLQFKATGCDGSSSATTSFQQCNGQNVPISSMKTTFNVQFIEGFALAFKPMVNDVEGTIIVGNKFLSESGYLLPDQDSPGGSHVTDIGRATTGTHLILRFTNIPNGVNIYVTKSNVSKGTSEVSVGVPAITASDVNDSDASGSMSCSGKAYDQNQPAIKVSISGGKGEVAWVVDSIDSSFNYQKTIAFGVAVSYTPNTTLDLPGLTNNGGVEGALGPISLLDSKGHVYDYAVPLSADGIPRFLDIPKTHDIFKILPCATNILFPYVTIKAGFDTGIALVNTSLDSPIIGTQTQHGACKMYYFDDTTTPPATQTSCDIKAGGMITFSMMTQGGIPSQTCADSSTVTNVAVPIGWQGYAIAGCNFQYGRGFAFISDRNTPSLGSQGYLPLILSTCGRSPYPFDDFGCGEMLGM